MPYSMFHWRQDIPSANKIILKYIDKPDLYKTAITQQIVNNVHNVKDTQYQWLMDAWQQLYH